MGFNSGFKGLMKPP